MATRLLSFAIWALVAVSAVFWLTRLLSRADGAPAHTVTVSATAAVAAADLSRLLGSTRVAAADAPATEPAVDARYKLVGVVAPRSEAATGLALIAVGDKPARPVSLGGVVDGSLVLLAVNHRHAELGPAGGAPTVRLELPAVPEPNRSVRAAPAVVPAPPAAQPVPPRQPVQPARPLPGAPGQVRGNPAAAR